MFLQSHVKNEAAICPLFQCLWPPNLSGLLLTLMDSCCYSLVRSRDKLKTLQIYTTISMAIKLGKVVTLHEDHRLKKLYNPSITWFCKVR